LGITQHQLAVLAEVSPRFVYDLERGKATIYLGLFLAVIQALGLQIELPQRKVDF
jgi:DNA-binding XRE family transcriptional regulator